MRIFVYGTLRRGGAAHGLMRGARFVAAACTQARYTLVDLGDYPALIGGGQSEVQGEIYEIDDGLLRALDDYEGCPGAYFRAEIALRGGGAAEAWVMPASRARGRPVIAGGDWLSTARRPAR